MGAVFDENPHEGDVECGDHAPPQCVFKHRDNAGTNRCSERESAGRDFDCKKMRHMTLMMVMVSQTNETCVDGSSQLLMEMLHHV